MAEALKREWLTVAGILLVMIVSIFSLQIPYEQKYFADVSIKANDQELGLGSKVKVGQQIELNVLNLNGQNEIKLLLLSWFNKKQGEFPLFFNYIF